MIGALFSSKYMENTRIEDLIAELHALRLRETAIIAQIEQETTRTAPTSDGPETRRPTSEPQQAATARPSFFKRGDRVRIKNKIRKPATAGTEWVESRERTATVTKIEPGQVHITTDNGTRTWRAPNNLEKA